VVGVVLAFMEIGLRSKNQIPGVNPTQLEDEHWGKGRLRRWDNKHARQDADTPFSVILVKAHLEREKPLNPFWMGYHTSRPRIKPQAINLGGGFTGRISLETPPRRGLGASE